MVEASSEYDVVLSGSDQLWSPGGLKSHFYTLEFCKKGVRRVSWASSFGVATIPEEQLVDTRKYLLEMDKISCRELSGCEIVKQLTGRPAIHVCDPVMMFSATDWKALVPNNKRVEEAYIFAYFLGENINYRKQVQEFARRKGLKIVTLRHLDQYVPSDEAFGDYAFYDVSPEDFINLISNADFVCTDSFHGSCFSIIFNNNKIIYYFIEILIGELYAKNKQYSR